MQLLIKSAVKSIHHEPQFKIKMKIIPLKICTYLKKKNDMISLKNLPAKIPVFPIQWNMHYKIELMQSASSHVLCSGMSKEQLCLTTH